MTTTTLEPNNAALDQATKAGKKADRDDISNTLLCNGTDDAKWWGGMVFDAAFLDVPIQKRGRRRRRPFRALRPPADRRAVYPSITLRIEKILELFAVGGTQFSQLPLAVQETCAAMAANTAGAGSAAGFVPMTEMSLLTTTTIVVSSS